MKIFLFTSISLLAAIIAAQNINIGAPADGAHVSPGSNIIVEVDRPLALTGSKDVAVVVGFQSCTAAPCPSPNDAMGIILYSGTYTPVLHDAAEHKPPYQNFTVTIPDSAPKGAAQLNVLHLTLVGAGPLPFLEAKNISLNVT